MLLASDVPSSPRPRPPARARRAFSGQFVRSSSSSSDAPPPPTYAFAMSDDLDPFEPSTVRAAKVLLASPPSLSKQMLEVEGNPETVNWLSEKSREELSLLLLKAKEVIDERDKELGMTSAVCKSLLERNVLLKAKHDAVLVRLPESSEVPHFSPLTDDGTLGSAPGNLTVRQAYGRRVSTTSRDELARLADQNADFLSKLEKLEADSTEADKSGRRRLRELEKEIMSLRDELQRGHAWMEESVKRATPRAVDTIEEKREEAERKRRDREVRVKQLKAKTRPWDVDEESAALLDFAPISELNLASIPRPAAPLSPRTPHQQGLVSLSSTTPVPMLLRFPSTLGESEAEDDPRTSPPPSSTVALEQRTRTRTKSEYAIVFQLLGKIRELEETNEQLTSDHRSTLHRLHVARKEAETISQVWDELGDEAGVELEMVVDASETELHHPSTARTVRFRSIKRKRSKILAEPDAPHLAGSAEAPLGLLELGSQRGGQRGKVRKGLAGLFDASTTPMDSDDHLSIPSPLAGSLSPVDENPSHTLVNELGQEQIALLEAGNFGHTRTLSICDLAQTHDADPLLASALSDVSSHINSIQNQSAPLSSPRVSPDGLSLSETDPTELEDDKKDTMVVTVSPTTAPSSVSERRGMGALVLELWLWLQFIIIIIVFVYMMAKRGPQSVLGERAAQRRGLRAVAPRT